MIERHHSRGECRSSNGFGCPEKESKGSAIWREIKGLLWVLVAVLLFHTFVAKPFYIPSESMMPTLLKGDRLVVSKYPYGWSWVSPSFHVFPHWQGRLFGKTPERGDIVIVTPPGQSDDYIKRVIGLPGDTIEVRGGRLVINGKPVKSERRPPVMVPVDINVPCGIEFSGFQVRAADGNAYCRLPIVRETLPNGVSYDTIDLGQSAGDDYGPVKVPADHLFLMGDNRDRSADSRFDLGPPENGLGGPVPWENIGGRAEFITFSLDGTSELLNPFSWFEALRSGRAGTSLRAHKD
ncbi:signal peptidase I [Sphingomonas sediminicola]|uniref:Signal peptidase I n=1 Tax=Sphingomonas sediminicola TaxID=386874 RepID=A0ABX6TBV5_9SPHN|nr:signal peptidase I [Sphingomonas sediminicola]